MAQTPQTVADLFGHVSDGLDEQPCPVRGHDPNLPPGAYPRQIEPYWFNPNLLVKMIRIFMGHPTNPNTLLFGDTGAGKSSMVQQVATRLGWPVFSIACSGRLRVEHLFGSYEMADGATQWRDGPLLAAMRCGGVFLANEVMRLDNGEQMALAEVLDTGTITVPQTGEIVSAAPRFRFFGTANSSGFGDESGAYAGERLSSFAFVDRFQRLFVDYPPYDAELSLLGKATKSSLKQEVLSAMVHLAEDVRKAFIGRGGDLRATVSTRALVTWACESASYARSAYFTKAADEALDDTIVNGLPESDASIIRELWQKWITQELDNV